MMNNNFKFVDELSKNINLFYAKQQKWVNALNNANESYSKDFSVLLKQNIIDTFNEIHEHKELILTSVLLLLTKIEKYKNEISSISVLAIEDMRSNAQKIAELNFAQSFLNYGIEVNKIIAFFRTQEGSIYENQLIEANKIIVLWNTLLQKYAEMIKYIEAIRTDVVSISNDKTFQ